MAMNARRKVQAPVESQSVLEPTAESIYQPPQVDNPAVELQRRVSEAFAPGEQRWSPRKALFVMVSASAVLWGAIGAGVFAMLK
jgi:hypothetical protein